MRETPEIQSSEVLVSSWTQLQVHMCRGITDEMTLRRTWEKVAQKVAFAHCKSQPCAWRVRDKGSGLLFEQYRDNGSVGTGNKILRLLKKKKIIDTMVCVFVSQVIIPLNPSMDHSSIISAVNVTPRLTVELH